MVKNPISVGDEPVYVESINTDIIIDRFKQTGLNVSRFFEGIDKVDIYKCPKSHYRFYSPETIAGDAQFYEELQNLKADYYAPERGEFGVALKRIKDGSKVLEVGSGDGTFLAG